MPLPDAPMETVTLRGWVVVMLNADGSTDMLGVTLFTVSVTLAVAVV
jgi:hypothetical protein